MNGHNFLAFIATVTLLVVTPGPVLVLVTALSAARGLAPAILATLGASLSITLQLAIAGLSLLSLIHILPEWLAAIQLVAGLYIAGFGLRLLLRPGAATHTPAARDPAVPSKAKPPKAATHGDFLTGFMVSSVNPKSILFFAAIFPQFLDPARSAAPQVLTLCFTFQAIFTCGVLAYAFAGAWLSKRLSILPPGPWASRILGLGLLALGLGFGVLPQIFR